MPRQRFWPAALGAVLIGLTAAVAIVALVLLGVR
jgi:hypothetical protein